MRTIKINGVATPIHFGLKALHEFTKMSGVNFEQTVTGEALSTMTEQELAISGIESMIQLVTIGLNEGARRSKSDTYYSEDDVWDIMDSQPELFKEISEIFMESITPLTDKLGAQNKDFRKPTQTK